MIERLFSIPVYIGRVVNKDAIDEELSKSDLSVGVRPQIEEWNCDCKSTFRSEDAAENWKGVFYDAIHPNISEYLDSCGPMYSYEYQHVSSWINFYDQGDFQEMHTHQNRSVSFSYSYYHKEPKDWKNASQFKFKSPIENLILNQMEFSAFHSGFTPNIGEGDLLIFPSWLYHMVTKHKTNERRITISGNISVTAVEN